jgi:hypothetical protein
MARLLEHLAQRLPAVLILLVLSLLLVAGLLIVPGLITSTP